MKKILIALLLGTAVVSGAEAQNNKVTSAYNYFKDYSGDPSDSESLIKAKKNIDVAKEHEQTMNSPKMYKYRGMIYFAISVDTNEAINAHREGALQIAAESYQGAIDNADKRTDVDKMKSELIKCGRQAFNAGSGAYGAKEYQKSSDFFMMSFDILKNNADFIDTNSIFNAALTSELAGNDDRALELYNASLEYHNSKEKIYVAIAGIYKKQENNEKLLETYNEALAAVPGSQAILVELINFYISNDMQEKALGNLTLAIENEPENASFYFARGTLHDKSGNIEDAVADYTKAGELRPDYFEAWYNLGAIYVNESGTVQEKMNELPMSAQKEYDALKIERDALYKKAIAPLEKALEIQPEDTVAGQTLIQLYAKVGDNEKYEALKARFE